MNKTQEKKIPVTNKIISIWGSPSSGKTTLSLKLSNEISKKKKNVILILADCTTPALSTVMPQIDAGEKSLGALLSAPLITQESILKNCILANKSEHLSVISYLHGENEKTYAKYSKERVVDLFILLKHIADYVIIDCSSNLSNDILSKSALELSDKVIRLITPDLKATSFYASSLPKLSQRKYNLQNHIKVLSNIKENMPKDYMASRFGGISLELPHLEEIEQQYIEARLLEVLTDKKSQKYRESLSEIVDIIAPEERVLKATTTATCPDTPTVNAISNPNETVTSEATLPTNSHETSPIALEMLENKNKANSIGIIGKILEFAKKISKKR